MMTEARPLIVDPPSFDASADSPFQQSVQQEAAIQNNQSFGLGNGTPGTTTNIFTVPAGQSFAVIACTITTNVSTGPSYAQLKHGTVNMGDGWVSTNAPLNLCANGPIIFPAGTTVQFTTGAGNPGNVVGVLVGYLFNPTQQAAPIQKQTTAPLIG